MLKYIFKFVLGWVRFLLLVQYRLRNNCLIFSSLYKKKIPGPQLDTAPECPEKWIELSITRLCHQYLAPNQHIPPILELAQCRGDAMPV